MKEIFEQLAKKLTAAKVPCVLTLTEWTVDPKFDFTIELGSNFPDKLASKVFDAFEGLKGTTHNFSVCASASGGKIILHRSINGGTRKYSRR